MNWSKEDKLLTLIAVQTLSGEAPSQIKKCLWASLDWIRLFNIATEQGLAPPLYRHFHRLEILDSLPEWLKENLYQSYRQTTIQNLYFLKFLKELEDILKKMALP